MNRKIEDYYFVWNTDANQGELILQLAKSKDGIPCAPIFLDSPQEGQLILDLLRTDKQLYYDDECNLILSGFGDLSKKPAPKKKKAKTTRAKTPRARK